MVRWVSKHCDPVMATGWHMVLGSLPLAALSLALEGDELLPRLAQIDGACAAGHEVEPLRLRLRQLRVAKVPCQQLPCLLLLIREHCPGYLQATTR